MEYFKLRDGNKLPVIALGPGAVVRKEVLPYAHLSSNPIVKIGQKVVNKLISGFIGNYRQVPFNKTIH